MHRGFKKRCEEQAADLRKRCGKSEHECLPAKSLAAELKVEILEPAEIPELEANHFNRLVTAGKNAWSAVTFSVDGFNFVIANPTHSPARHESDLMHEMGHIVIGHKPIRVMMLPGFPFPLREYRPDDEDEASWLGAVLQLPRASLEWALRNNMTLTEIAAFFNASQQMVRYRIGMTGINRQFSRNRDI